MIEIVGFIQQLYIAKQQKKGNGRQTIKQAQHDKNSAECYQKKYQVHPGTGQRPHPLETQVRKEILRLDIKFAYPAIGGETDCAHQH